MDATHGLVYVIGWGLIIASGVVGCGIVVLAAALRSRRALGAVLVPCVLCAFGVLFISRGRGDEAGFWHLSLAAVALWALAYLRAHR
jgi:hypothetical protein